MSLPVATSNFQPILIRILYSPVILIFSNEVKMAADPPVFDVQILSHAYGGESFARLPDNRAVFVPFALPGETVRIRLVEEKRGFARAAIVEVLSLSPARVIPRCAHYGVCGGCHYQHMDYPEQLAAKTSALRDLLVRIGHIADPPVRPAVASPSPWNYRNYIQFHQAADGRLGYIDVTGQNVIPISECHLPLPDINHFWPQLDMEPVEGLDRIGIRQGDDNDLQLIFESSDPLAPDFSVDFDLSAVHLGPERSILLSGDDHVMLTVLDRPFRVSAGSFFQVNLPLAGAMVSHLLENLPLTSDSLVMDIYSGVGLFSSFIAPRVREVVAVESSPYACYDFELNLKEFDNVSLYEGPAEEILSHLPHRPDVVLVDPPRAGLEKSTLDGILSFGPRCIAYVSCDPSTFARDARRLAEGGYHLLHVTPFDLFPQTYHIESISYWEK